MERDCCKYLCRRFEQNPSLLCIHRKLGLLLWLLGCFIFNPALAKPVVSSDGRDSMCLASSTLPFTDGYHGYPMDVYAAADPVWGDTGSKVEQISSGAEHRTWTCSSYDLKAPRLGSGMTDHNCSDIKLCPLSQKNIDRAVKRQSQWMTGATMGSVGSSSAASFPTSVLCNMKLALEEHQSVNVVVLGGSVTAGVTTQGCCTDKNKCGGPLNPVNAYCNWVPYMRRWLDHLGHQNNASIKIYNAAHPGYNADTYKEKIFDKLDESVHRGFRFKKSDVVLLDLSVNDANTFGGRSNKIMLLERGLEGLIRRLYYSMSAVADSMPTIVLLEMWPGQGG